MNGHALRGRHDLDDHLVGLQNVVVRGHQNCGAGDRRCDGRHVGREGQNLADQAASNQKIIDSLEDKLKK